MTGSNKELCKYLECEDFEANERMIDFYLRCRDNGWHFADADRYAILNTLFGYAIGEATAEKLNTYVYEHDDDIYEFMPTNCRDLLEKANEDLDLKLDFSKFRTEKYEEYSFFKPEFKNLVNSETSYGEPQWFTGLPNGRSLEVCHEEEGLAKNEQYYSCRVHASDSEFDDDDFHSTMGIIDQMSLDEFDYDEIMTWARRVANTDRFETSSREEIPA